MERRRGRLSNSVYGKAMLRQRIMPYPRQPKPVQRTQLDCCASIAEQADSPGEYALYFPSVTPSAGFRPPPQYLFLGMGPRTLIIYCFTPLPWRTRVGELFIWRPRSVMCSVPSEAVLFRIRSTFDVKGEFASVLPYASSPETPLLLFLFHESLVGLAESAEARHRGKCTATG